MSSIADIKRATIVLVLLLCVIATNAPPVSTQTTAAAAGQNKFELTIDNIMRGPELVGYEPRAVRWSGDSQRIYFQWKRANDSPDKDYDTYVVSRDGSGLTKLTEAEARNAPPVGGERSKDRKSIVFVDDGDVILYDNVAGQRRQLTKTSDLETNAHFTRDQRRVYFTRANNLYTLSLDNGSLVQMSDIRVAGAAPQQPAAAGGFGFGQRGGGQQARTETGQQQQGTESQEYIKKEQKELIDVVKRRAQKREEDEARRKRENPRKPFQLGPRQSVAALQLSPDEKYVIAQINETGEGSKNTIVANYVTESAYSEDIPSRTKVGDLQPRSRIAIIGVATGDVKWVDHGQRLPAGAPEARPGRQAPPESGHTSDEPAQQTQQQGNRELEQRESQQRDGQAQRRPGPRDRDVQLSLPVWSEDGARAVLAARAADNKDRWALAVDPETGKTRPILSEHDDAWVDGPGASTLGWMKDNQHVYFQSERTGYAHLYSVSFDGGDARQLTSGKWEVTGVQMSDDKSRFFLTTSEVHPGERHFYVMPADGGERIKITSMPGSNQAVPSPDEKAL
ncbi:MAG TPA: DPP IV N-terminal domain-containing protein, partial [Blastocatellia bacterium]|nr:DPP IV N-terminal domain-containing protein [Blastocatellia bacterium]